jgi:protein-S-isoprenylcysteine O-methyltransferase Ste14
MQNQSESSLIPPAPADDRPNRLPWPPLIYAAVLVLAWLLERSLPLSAMPVGGAYRSAGWVLVVLGIAAGVAGIVKFQSLGTPVDPTAQAKTLATGGVYALTRNPMYLGAVVAFAGLAFAFGSAWLLIGALLMPLALRKLAIEPEEAYLARRFGDPYAAYCARVRRWI